MSYNEPLIIPDQVARDKRLTWTEKAAFAIMARLQKERPEVFNREIFEFLDVTYRELAYIKSHLSRCGYLTKVVNTRGQIKYVMMDPALSVLEKIKQFLRLSTVFQHITALELLTLHPDPARVLYVMEVYEFTYRKSKKAVDKPLFLLKKGLKSGVTPDKGFTRDWWLIEQNQAAENAAAKVEREKREASEREREKKEQEAFDKYLDTLTHKEADVLREQAIQRLKANGGIPKHGAQTMIRIEMRKIWEGAKNA